jgi:hypothetical protein
VGFQNSDRVINERHLLDRLAEFVDYYNVDRPSGASSCRAHYPRSPTRDVRVVRRRAAVDEAGA